MQTSMVTGSCTSSVVDARAPGSPTHPPPSSRSALGGSSKSGLNHTSTYYYGEQPLKPVLCTGNQYNAVGSYSMFGSQVRRAARATSASARFASRRTPRP